MFVQVARERLSLMRQDFHLSHVRGKERKMIVDKDAQLFKRVIDPTGAPLKPLKHAAKTMVLDQKQQLFLRLAVMIKAGETHARRARDIAHRGRVITLSRKNARGRAQNQFELLIVASQLIGHKNEATDEHRFSQISRRKISNQCLSV